MRKMVTVALLALLCLGSCASLSGYPWYILDPAKDNLQADKKVDDLNMTATCTLDAFDKAKCIVMLREAYFKMEKELLDLRQELKDCQAGH